MDPLLAFDRAVGDVVERTVRSHHRRRLRRLGWEHALEPSGGGLWAAGDPPPRGGNSVEILIDGACALPRFAAELEAALPQVKDCRRSYGVSLLIRVLVLPGNEPRAPAGVDPPAARLYRPATLRHALLRSAGETGTAMAGLTPEGLA